MGWVPASGGVDIVATDTSSWLDAEMLPELSSVLSGAPSVRLNVGWIVTPGLIQGQLVLP